MAGKEHSAKYDPEVAAMNAVVMAVQDLDTAAQQRVVSYVVRRFKLEGPASASVLDMTPVGADREPEQTVPRDEGPVEPPTATTDDGLDGINSVARKWMSRNGFTVSGLSRLFSLGIDEIDLVAKEVPGKNKKERMRSVILLKAAASYLGGGAARVTHEQVKETCLHYDAFDTDNFANYLKKMSAEVGGTKEAGYTLTPRGLTAATELIKEITNPKAK